jgi:hypothetical protein
MSKPTVVRVQLPVSPPNASEVLVYDKDRSFRLILDKTTLPVHVLHILHRYPNAYFTASVTLHQPQQRIGIGLKLLQGLAINAGNHPRHQPARLAHFNDNCQTGVLIKRIKRTAQVINLGHGAHPSVSSSDDDANPRRLPHSFFRPKQQEPAILED